MIGEDLPDKNTHCGWPNSNYSVGTCSIPLNNAMRSGQPGFNNPGDWPNVYSFRSRHTSSTTSPWPTAQSGSSAMVLNITTYRALATIRGSEVASLN